ncbi:MAG: hypothetical protein J6N98_02645 [Prevotella sp.]|nr:hypothetical protein [Prevotella sp.]
MRKHFLLLFLMALLPLAGFATIIVDHQPTVGAGATFDDADKTPITADGTATGASNTYTWYYYASTTNSTPDIDADGWALKADLKVKNAGTYYLYYKVVSGESTEATYGPIGCGTYTIAKADLLNTDYAAPTGAANDALTYDATEKALLTAAATYGTTGSVAKCGAITYTLNSTNYSTYSDVKATNADTYTITWAFAGSANYKGKTGTVDVIINQKVFNATNLTVEITNNTKTYNGQSQAPTIKVKDNALSTAQAPVYLATTDYAVTYKLSTDDNETDHKQVGTHNITITGTGAGNYSNAALANVGTLTINRATAYVQINDVEKDYNGLAYAPATDGEFTFTYSGLKAGETTVQANITNNATVSGYAGITDAGTNKVLTLGNTVDQVTSRNYQFIEKAKGTLTINKVNLTITLPTNYTDGVNQKDYGEDDPDFTTDTWKTNNIVLTGVVQYDANNDNDYEDEGDIDETAAILADLTISRTNSTVEAAGEYEGVLVATATTTAALKNYNYDFTTDASKGNFKIVGVKLYIGINDQEVTYTGVQAVLPTLTIDDLIVSGLQGEDTPASVIGNNVPTLKFTETTPAINAGYYDIELEGLATMGSYEVEYISGSLHIAPATVTATIPTQTLKKGATAINVNGWTVTGIVAADDAENYAQTLSNDPNTPIVLVNEANLNTAGTYDNSAVGKEGCYLLITNPNYVLAGADADNKVWGTIIVLDDNEYILDPANTDLATQLATLNNQANMNVSLAARTLKKDIWYTMVLPFTTTPKDVVASFKEYVVVNRMANTSNKDHISFVLEMNQLPAGEPFLIKVANDVTFAPTGANIVGKFEGVKILAALAPAAGEGDTKFVGTYTTKSFTNGDTEDNYKYGYLNYSKIGDEIPGTSLKWENKWYTSGTRVFIVNPLEAYLIYQKLTTTTGRELDFDENPLITVQEADGSTTAITEVSAGQFQAVKADGWYTLNGVKLQGAPTEKGIYINNGKKIVVK